MDNILALSYKTKDVFKCKCEVSLTLLWKLLSKTKNKTNLAYPLYFSHHCYVSLAHGISKMVHLACKICVGIDI